MNKQLSEEIQFMYRRDVPHDGIFSTSNWNMKSNKVFEYEPSNFAADYRIMGKKQLYECATENRIPSRSKMRKKELIQALVNL
tara:strand:+ start:765 stop:1013 length:249 start_codon:yes stop_codon:yes gene_type:complete